MKRKTLHSIYLEKKYSLESQIKNMSLPNDLEKLYGTFADFLNSQLSPQGEFASQLTEPEYHILQSSMFIRELQREMDHRLISSDATPREKESDSPVTSIPMAFAYSALGGIILSPVSSGAALAGAMTGLLISTLLYKYQPSAITGNKYTEWLIAKPAKESTASTSAAETRINTEEILEMLDRLCSGIDELLSVITNQVKRLIPKTTSVIEEIGPILTECQTHIGRLYESGYDKESIPYFEDVWQHIGVEFRHYSEENKMYFLETSKSGCDCIKERYPAILVDGKLYAKGAVTVPKAK